MAFFEDRENVGPPPDPFRIGNGGNFRSPVAMRWIVLGATLLVLFIVANVAKSLYADWLWFDSVAYGSVFRRVVAAKVALFAVGAAISAAVIALNIWIARRYSPEGFEESFIEEVDPQAIRRIVTIALLFGTLFLAVIFGSVAAGAWEIVLRWLNAVPFGATDPAFNRDISFFLFDLPAFHFLQVWALWLVIVSGAAAAAVYGLTLSLQRFELSISRGMRIHLSVLAGLLLLLIAVGTYLSIFDLATDPSGLVAGATYTDINARLPVRYILIVLAAFAGLATIVNAFISTSYRLPIFALGLWVLTGIVGGAVYPAVIQRTVVDPNEIRREATYIKRNIDMTRTAYGLDAVIETAFPAEPAVSTEEIDANPATIENMRLLDPRPLRDTLNQIQTIRPLYFFNDIDVDRYQIGDETRQVMLSVRELDIRRARQTQATNWTRERLQLTHGYGAVTMRVNRVMDEGLPELMTRDIPPSGEEIPLSPEGARIYFGELTDHYVIVDTEEPEFDYPVGEGFAETSYEAERGIQLSNFLRRFVLAWELGDTNILISGQIRPDSDLLMNRTLASRIDKVAPFLLRDADPYGVVVDGRLLWIQDAYTTSSSFPYSQSQDGINYIRNSVKIVVDAQLGDMTFYLMDEQDPVAATWASIFPDLFTPQAEMPEAIRSHLRYPEGLFRVQAQLYTKYHITDPRVFFVGEDVWNIPTELFSAQEQPVDPYYVILTLPGEQEPEFVVVMPFTPRNRQNTIAWLAGRSDGEHLGALRSYRFPTGDLVFGPAQIEARIDQDPLISQQLSLWNRSGSQVIRGNLLMIPVGDSFLFVEPIYLQAENSRIPEMRRVVVANGNNIAMERTFERSLDVVFGRRAPTPPGIEDADVAPPPAPPPPPAGAPTATPTPPPPAAEAPAGSLEELLGEAEQAADAAERELDRLRAILEAIRQQQPTPPR